MEQKLKGASADADRAGSPADLSPYGSQPKALIPSARALDRRLLGRAAFLEAKGRVKSPGLMREAAARIADVEMALGWALGELIRYEPGDSRLVSNEFVSAACIDADLDDVESARRCLAQAIDARSDETRQGFGPQGESAVPNGDAPNG